MLTLCGVATRSHPFIIALAALALNAAVASPTRQTLSLDQGWRFHLGEAPGATAPAYDDRAWREVDVPHDYVIEGTFEETNRFPAADMNRGWHWLHGFLPVQPAVYRRTIPVPADAKGKRLWLEFDGVFSNSRYWLNGHEIGSQYSGYTRSRFDITSAADYGGKNVLVVQVDPRFDGWWYEGGGIYRHVRLVALDPVHIAPDGIFAAPAVGNPGDGVRADATVLAITEVTNSSAAPITATLQSEILDAAGQTVAAASSDRTLPAGDRPDQSQPLVAGKSVPLSLAQHVDRESRNRRSGDDELRSSPPALRRRARIFSQRQTAQAPRRQSAPGSRRRRRGGAGPALHLAPRAAEGNGLQRDSPVAQSGRAFPAR